MKILISLGFLFISILNGVAFVVQPAWGGDLKATFENEVAGVQVKVLGEATRAIGVVLNCIAVASPIRAGV